VNQKSQSTKPNLYLVGFMGVGKSAIGRRVARELGYKFLDSDDCIVKQVGKKIPAIFAAEGEAHFRAYEREFIESGHPTQGCVVSCGGGLVVQEGMSELLKSKGVVVCLFASVESIIERTSRNNNRPLLNVTDPEARIRELLAAREPVYMDSGACISTDGRTIPEVVKHMLRTYRACAKRLQRK
jgi:shikimate kinase|tara:strand:+ start:1023 stop:1574 length:552 start_codon:yes stop_codon:yes gene_type:complete